MLAVLGLVVVAGCTSDTPDVRGTFNLSSFASSDAPYSTSSDIALLSEAVVCVINSFESQIHCVDRSDGSVTVFGGEGEGAEEFGGLTGIERGQGGQIAAVDYGRRQLTFFEPDGAIVSTTQLPPDFQPRLLQGDRLFGFRLVMPDFSAGQFTPSYVPTAADAYSGEVLWERTDLADIVERECFNPAVGALTRGGGLVFEVCEHELAFFAHTEASTVSIVASPSYVEALPNERDVSYHVGVTSTVGLPMTESEIEAAAAEFREQPKAWVLKPISFGFDDRNRLWVATTRDRDAFSYFDVWNDTEYFAAVRVGDRLMGFDILGSTLVALVERANGD